MVYCQRCGTENPQEAKYCTKCGSALYLARSREHREDTCFDQSEKRVEEECFRIPYGGAIAGIIVGVFIILLGLTIAFRLDVWRWAGPLIAIVIGTIIVIGAIFGHRRR